MRMIKATICTIYEEMEMSMGSMKLSFKDWQDWVSLKNLSLYGGMKNVNDIDYLHNFSFLKLEMSKCKC